MLILAFDTTAAACSVALWRDGAVVGMARAAMDQGQAEALMPMIEDVMAQSTVDYTALDRIAVTVGPGSFTGVRVGLATARGLALAAAKPVIGVTSPEALAAAVPAHELSRGTRIVTAIDTKRGDLYVQQFDSDRRPLSEIIALTPDALGAWLGAGSVVAIGDAAAAIGARAMLSTASPLPDPALIAQIAAMRGPIAGGPLPLYIHPPAVTVK